MWQSAGAGGPVNADLPTRTPRSGLNRRAIEQCEDRCNILECVDQYVGVGGAEHRGRRVAGRYAYAPGADRSPTSDVVGRITDDEYLGSCDCLAITG